MAASYTNVFSIKVSPGIGMARVGNSDEYFIGPETPGLVPDPGNWNYKDSQGGIKRQAQRFRVFGYDPNYLLLGEITNGDSVNGEQITIEWDVHVTNMKSANYSFQGQYGFDPSDLRNSTIQGNPSGSNANSPNLVKPEDRDLLIIDPGLQKISGVNQGPVELLSAEGTGSTIFNFTGTSNLSNQLKYDPPQDSANDIPVTYTPATVSLGRLYTDGDGRLVFVGGEGKAESCTTPKVVISKSKSTEADPQYNGNSYFNNPGWYDDTCGGSINAKLISGNGSTLIQTNSAARQGWVAVAPPHYAPASINVVSLLDLQFDMFPSADPYTGNGPLYVAYSTGNQISLGASDVPPKYLPNLDYEKIQLSFQAQAPSIASFQGETYIAVVSNASSGDRQLYIGNSQDNYAAFNLVAGADSLISYASPSLTVFNGQLYCAISVRNPNSPSLADLYLGVSDDGSNFVFEPVTNASPLSQYQAPALTAFNGSLYCAIASAGNDGGDAELMIASSQDGSASKFSFNSITPTAINNVQFANLSLAVFAGKLYCGYINVEDGTGLFGLASSTDGAAFEISSLNTTLGNPGKGSAYGVSLSAYNGQLYYSTTVDNVGTQFAVSSDGSTFAPYSSGNGASGSATALATNVPVNFYRDIYPILRTVTDYAWTNERAFHGHRPGTSGDFLQEEYLAALANPGVTPGNPNARGFVFNFIRPPTQEVFTTSSPDTPVTVPPPPAPAPLGITASKQEVQRADLMPRLFGNGGSLAENQANGTNYPNQWLALTNHQLEKFQHWVNGNFVPGVLADAAGQYIDLPGNQTVPVPDQLDIAALQPTVGGGFHPGIELTYLMAQPVFFDSPFRFAEDTVPGSIAGYMSVPWQGDFWSCNISWWPALRPDIVVLRNNDSPPVLTNTQWFRSNEIPPQSDSVPNYEGGYAAMAKSWNLFGLVTPVTDSSGNAVLDQGQQVFEETERAPSLDTPSLLVSIDASQGSSGKALSENNGALTVQSVNPTDPSQQWNLTASSNSPVDLFIQDPTSGNVLTVDFTTGDISLAPQQVSQADSQLWQYTATGFPDTATGVPDTAPGYPGHFYLTSKINLQRLTVLTDGTVGTAAANGSPQIWLLEASTPN